MKITKFGHCCFLIEDNGVRILTDPGKFSSTQNGIKDLDAVVITHEHDDHMHIESLKIIRQNNPAAIIVTNNAVKNLLEQIGYAVKVVEHNESFKIKTMLLEGFGTNHAAMYPNAPTVQNTGYFLNNKFFLPGDCFFDPGKAVDILGLPACGGWLKVSEMIDYGLKLKPRIAIPIHDGNMKEFSAEHMLPPKYFEPQGIKFMTLELNQQYEL